MFIGFFNFFNNRKSGFKITPPTEVVDTGNYYESADGDLYVTADGDKYIVPD